MKVSLGPAAHADLRARAESARGAVLARYSHPPMLWQPVHTVYVPGDRFTAQTTTRYGRDAGALLDAHAADADSFAAAFGIEGYLAGAVRERVAAKLASGAVEDVRIDFEDGYTGHDDATEDADVTAAAGEVAAAHEAGTLPRRWGVRVASFADGRYDRAVATLDGLLTTVLERAGVLPPGFTVTFPKVETARHVAVLAALLDRLEVALGLEHGVLRFEVQVETPRTLIDPSGSVALPAIVDAADGRLSAAHFGVFDYTAAIGLPPGEQRLDHPACDLARHLMQVALSGTGVELADGSTNVVPASETRAAVHAAWRAHAGHVRHSLRYGFYQSWDMHPAHLVSRYAVVYDFHLAHLDEVIGRVRAWTAHRAGTGSGRGFLDEPATMRALVGQLRRAVGCGAADEPDVLARTGLESLT